MSDSTADLKDVFLAEMVQGTIDEFEDLVSKAIAEQDGRGVPHKIQRTPDGLECGKAYCRYRFRLDKNVPTFLVDSGLKNTPGENREKLEFRMDAVGAGVLNMRVLWRQPDTVRALSTAELVEFCIDELMARNSE